MQWVIETPAGRAEYEQHQRAFEISVAGYFANPNRAAALTPFRVTGRVQPIAGLHLAVVRRLQRAVNEGLVSGRGVVRNELGNLGRRRRPASQV